MTRQLTDAQKARYAACRFGSGVPCQHGGHLIKRYGGIWFAVGGGAVCHGSPDTQHRPEGVPVPERKPAPKRRTRQAKTPEVRKALSYVIAAPQPLPASVVARGADTGSTVGHSGGRRWRG